MRTPVILVVDDEVDVANAAADWLSLNGFETQITNTAPAALQALNSTHIDIIVSDLRMPGRDGQWLLEQISGIENPPGFVILTGHGDVPAAVKALKAGANDFLEKPYDPDHLLITVNKICKQLALRNELARLQKQLRDHSPFKQFFPNESTSNAATIEQLSRLAKLHTPLAIMGETGTRKTAIARAIHEAGDRASHRCVSLSALSLGDHETANEQLFGGPRFADSRGAIREAGAGTLIITDADAIHEHTGELLVAAFKSKQVQPPGFDAPFDVQCRLIVCCSHSQGRDLAGSLAATPIILEPLRKRLDDLPALFAHFVTKHARNADTVPDCPSELIARLLQHDWPNNLEELEQAAVSHVAGLDIRLQDNAWGEATNMDLKSRVREFESQIIRATLTSTGGNQSHTARLLGIPRRTLGERMKRLDIS
ncbi:MAG: response regulator [Pseudomonadota bacterium]